MELVYPYGNELGPVRLWCAAYLAVMLLGGALFGNTFYARADPFEVYSSLVARLSVWGRRDGALVVRSPLANLDTVPVRPGLVAVVAVLFGSTAFDSFRDSSRWVTFVQDASVPALLLNNLALLGFCVGVGLVFALGCVLTGVGRDQRRTTLPNLFAHSVVPIIVGYIAPHYLTYLVETGQDTLIKASDPLGTGADLLGTGDWSINYWLSYHPTLLASIKVLAVVLGHVVGVIAAHDRAVRILPPRHQLTGQLPAARGDGGLHRRRSLPAVRRLTAPRRRRGAGSGSGGTSASTTAPTARPSAESPSSGRVRPATSIRSTVSRSSGRKCSPASRANPDDHAGDLLLRPAAASGASG